MSSGMLLMGILPLLIFVIVDSFSGLKTALVSAIVLAILEAGMSLYFFGELDAVTGFSVVLIIGLAIYSYYAKSAIFIKFQPVVLSGALGLALLIFYWIGKPLFYIMLMKYQHQLPTEVKVQLQNPYFVEFFKLSSHYSGYALLLHAGLCAWAALKLSNWWWIAVRVLGFYILLFMAAMVSSFHLRTITSIG